MGGDALVRQWVRVETPKASRYLQQLCKHFAHKVEAEFDAARGRAALPGGETRLIADDAALSIAVEGASPADMVRVRYVVEDHLLRFAFRENMQPLPWQNGPAPWEAA
jgi:hypothetical protein